MTRTLLTAREKTPGAVAEILQSMVFQLESIEAWVPAELQKATESVASFWDFPIRDVTSVMFIAISGLTVAPPLYESMAILGRDITRRRIMDAIESTGGIGRKKLKKLEETWSEWRINRNRSSEEGETQ